MRVAVRLQNQTVLHMRPALFGSAALTPHTCAMSNKTITPGELALALHVAEGHDLVATIPEGHEISAWSPGAGYTVNGTEVAFLTLSERNRHAGDWVFAIVGEGGANLDALFEAAVDAWGREIGQVDLLSGRLIALAANGTDVIAYLDKRLNSGLRVYDVLHVLEAAFPYLGALNLDSLVEFVRTVHRLTDGAGVVIYGPIEKWMSQRPEAAKELHARLSKRVDASTAVLFSLCPAALAVSSFDAAVDLAEGDVKSGQHERAVVGMRTLGRLLRMQLEDPAGAQGTRLEALMLGYLATGEEGLRPHAFEAAIAAMHKTSTFDERIRERALLGDRAVLKELATYVFLNESEFLARGDLLKWVELLLPLGPADPGIAEFDHALARLAKKPEFLPNILELLTRWVERFGVTGGRDKTFVEAFPDTSRAIARLPDALSDLMTTWLVASNRALAANAAPLLSPGIAPEAARCTFALATIDSLDSPDLKLLCRRLLGYVHEPKHLLSMALSLLRTANAPSRAFGLLDALLVNEIGYDFPGTTLEAIRRQIEATEDPATKAFLDDLAIRIDAPFKALEALGPLGELRIRGEVQRQISLHRSKQMARMAREAAKASIWRQIAMEIPIKAGVRTFSRDQEKLRPPIELKRHTLTAEMPRREVLDPIGNSIRLAMFRGSKRGGE